MSDNLGVLVVQIYALAFCIGMCVLYLFLEILPNARRYFRLRKFREAIKAGEIEKLIRSGSDTDIYTLAGVFGLDSYAVKYELMRYGYRIYGGAICQKDG